MVAIIPPTIIAAPCIIKILFGECIFLLLHNIIKIKETVVMVVVVITPMTAGDIFIGGFLLYLADFLLFQLGGDLPLSLDPLQLPRFEDA